MGGTEDKEGSRCGVCPCSVCCSLPSPALPSPTTSRPRPTVPQTHQCQLITSTLTFPWPGLGATWSRRGCRLVFQVPSRWALTQKQTPRTVFVPNTWAAGALAGAASPGAAPGTLADPACLHSERLPSVLPPPPRPRKGWPQPLQWPWPRAPVAPWLTLSRPPDTLKTQLRFVVKQRQLCFLL